MFGVKNNFWGQTYFWDKKNLGVKNIFGVKIEFWDRKYFWVKIKFGVKKFLGQKYFGVE